MERQRARPGEPEDAPREGSVREGRDRDVGDVLEVDKGRRVGKNRSRSIMSCKAAAARPDLACYMACNTSLSAKSAIAQLNIAAMGTAAPGGQQAGGRMSLDERMANMPRHTVGHDAPAATGKDSTVNAAVSLYNKHKGIK